MSAIGITESRTVPSQCHANAPQSPWLSFTHFDEFALIKRTISATDRSALNFATTVKMVRHTVNRRAMTPPGCRRAIPAMYFASSSRTNSWIEARLGIRGTGHDVKKQIRQAPAMITKRRIFPTGCTELLALTI